MADNSREWACMGPPKCYRRVELTWLDWLTNSTHCFQRVVWSHRKSQSEVIEKAHAQKLLRQMHPRIEENCDGRKNQKLKSISCIWRTFTRRSQTGIPFLTGWESLWQGVDIMFRRRFARQLWRVACKLWTSGPREPVHHHVWFGTGGFLSSWIVPYFPTTLIFGGTELQERRYCHFEQKRKLFSGMQKLRTAAVCVLLMLAFAFVHRRWSSTSKLVLKEVGPSRFPHCGELCQHIEFCSTNLTVLSSFPWFSLVLTVPTQSLKD